ncbi:MarR family transcriptional regulator [Ferrimicrobium acidiphilum]|uniref:MarR family transcriptional regulator n=1 Tax=Ferrimicrobium acidiphilum TaxID=121039 RepID=UPI0023F38EE3|nr:MarR family transcriptional regulator [Ferrimicrobium acidiphilum]
MDVLLVYPSSQQNTTSSDNQSCTDTSHLFTKVYTDSASWFFREFSPSEIAALSILATRMNDSRSVKLSTRELAGALGVSRDTAGRTLVSICGHSVGSTPVMTVSRLPREVFAPAVHILTFAQSLPFAWGGYANRFFVKLYHDAARALIKELEPELWATLLCMGVLMDAGRHVETTLDNLATRLRISPSALSERIRRLVDAGFVERLTDPEPRLFTPTTYRLTDRVPLQFGDDDWQLADELAQVSSVHVEQAQANLPSDTTTSSLVPCLRGAFNKIKREKETTTPTLVASSPSVVVDSKTSSEEILAIAKLCGSATVARWLDRYGHDRLVSIYKASVVAKRSRGGWIRKAIEDNWTLESSSSSDSQTHGSARRYGREQPPETGAQFYRLDHKASTLRAAELAGIELDEDDLTLPKKLTPVLIGELRASMR